MALVSAVNSLPEPYYDKDGITIYNADCRDILPYLPKVDLVLTDPPYGIGMDGGNIGYKGFNNFEKKDWDKSPPTRETLESIIRAGGVSILWGGNYFDVPPARCFLVWDKGAGFKGRSYAEAELAWTNMDANVRVFVYDPLARGDYRGKGHPTQKPIKLMTWCISFVPDAQTILDPFMGSGTTLVAAKQLGKKAIGIEIEEEYCKIAVERLAQDVLPL